MLPLPPPPIYFHFARKTHNSTESERRRRKKLEQQPCEAVTPIDLTRHNVRKSERLHWQQRYEMKNDTNNFIFIRHSFCKTWLVSPIADSIIKLLSLPPKIQYEEMQTIFDTNSKCREMNRKKQQQTITTCTTIMVPKYILHACNFIIILDRLRAREPFREWRKEIIMASPAP